MHSLDLNGDLCVNLDDYSHISDSIRLREKIDFYIETIGCPKEVSNFSVTFSFRDGAQCYISNLYLWAIPYRTEGFYRGDIDHDPNIYCGRDYFIQKNVKYDEMQLPIIQTLANRYSLYTTFAMVRTCSDCDLIIEAYNKNDVVDPDALYRRISGEFETFIADFLEAMHDDLVESNPLLSVYPIIKDKAFRSKIIKRKYVEDKLIISPRERDCLLAFADGYSAKEVSRKLGVSVETINTHSKTIKRKLNSKNITHAAVIAFKMGILDPE